MPADSRPSALVIAPEAPYPVRGGGALRTASLLAYLERHYHLDLIVFREPGAPHPSAAMPRELARRLTVIDLPFHLRSFPARAMRNSLRLVRRAPPLVDRFARFEAEIAAAVKGRRYRLGLIEHSWCAAYLEQIAPACETTVLDLHNIESILHARCRATEGPPTRIAHAIFEKASREFERRWLARFSQVLAASEDDATAARALAPGANVRVYPNAIPSRPRPSESRSDAIVFSGNMEYLPNRAAVRWFRRDIWPQLRRDHPDLVWRLVGKNPRPVEPLAQADPRIEVTGEVEDAVIELARAQAAVVPLLAGSGTRLKILEAWSAGTPVVSTTIGAEGLNATHERELLLADGAESFVESVSRLLKCKDLRDTLATSGRMLLEKEFIWEKAWEKLAF